MRREYGVDIKWLAVTSFEIRCGKTTVVTDPYITECVGTDLTWEAIENCDIICLGHAHWDHITDIPRLMDKFQPLILCGDQTAMPLAKWLNYTPSRIYPMYPDLELDFGEVKIRALYGRHTDLGSEYRNFLFTLPNGTKILLWGNDPTVEQVNICKALHPDIAIIQRSTNPKAIAAKAEFAAAIGCKVLIPHHHDFRGVDGSESIDAFEKEFLSRVPDGTFVRPRHGEWRHL